MAQQSSETNAQSLAKTTFMITMALAATVIAVAFFWVILGD